MEETPNVYLTETFADPERENLGMDIEALEKDIEKAIKEMDEPVYKSDKDLKKKREEMEENRNEMQRRYSELKKIEEDLKKLKEANNELQRSIGTLNSEKADLIKQIEDNNAQIKNLDQQIEIKKAKNEALKTKNAETDQAITNFESENKQIEDDLKDLESKIKRLTDENNSVENQLTAIKNEIEKVKVNIQAKEKEKQNLLAEIEEAKIYVYSKKVNDDVPFISIQTTTLYGLSKKGWPVYDNSKEKVKELQTEKLPIASIVGRTGSGKSFLANKISNDKLPVGPDTDIESDRRNNIIDIHYVQGKEGKWAGILSSTGYDEPLQANRKNMVENLPIPSLEESKSDESGLIHLKRFELLYDDLVITEEIKFDYIVRNGSLIILVVNSLKGSDLESLFKIKELISSSKEEERPEVLIVHNLHQLIKIEHVKEEIKCSIAKTFKMSEPEPDPNPENNPWKDQFGFTHLIIAADISVAGKYYNPKTIEVIQKKLFSIKKPKEFRLVESFMTACNESLISILESKIVLKHDTESNRIIDPQKTPIRPLQLRCHGCYNAFAREGFKPAYSKCIRELGDGSVVFYIDLELLDGVIQRRVVKRLKGWDCLLIWGERKNYEGYDPVEDEPIQNSDGNFVLNIPLQPQASSGHEFLDDVDLGSGIKRLGIKFIKQA